MSYIYGAFSLIGTLGMMALVALAAVVLSQAVFVAFFWRGAELAQKKQAIEVRDVVLALGEDRVWLSLLFRYPLASAVSATLGVVAARYGQTPSWTFWALVPTFLVLGPCLHAVKRAVATAALTRAMRSRPTLSL